MTRKSKLSLMASDNEGALLEAAIAARRHAYAPYSRYQVGAAVRCPDGQVFSGCNVENASYGLTVCAERNAIFAAVAAGQRHIDLVVVVTAASPPGTPCGACRQVLQEFASSPDMPVIVANEQGETRRFSLAELLPSPFILE